MARKTRFEKRMDKIHEEIMSIPVGPCLSYEERYQKELEKALKLLPFAVFIEAGAEVKRD